MDKKTLNNEIVLCRGAVRKARVAVIRKLIKKIKILKSCKKEGIKDKKIKKSERLFRRVQIMKKAKDDEVTRFALRNPDLDKYIKGTKIDMRQKALAHLAKHDAVIKKVNATREKIQNWEVELPLLLNSLGKKKKNLKDIVKKEGEKRKSSKTERKVSDVPKENKLQKEKVKIGKIKQTEEVIEPPKIEKTEKIEKIDDPFFMGKKMIAPKTLDNQEETKRKKVEVKSDKFNKDSYGSMLNAKPFKVKQESVFRNKIQKHVTQSEEKLHPSWAAKKVKLIKPFQGKKIKFSDE